MLFFLRLKPISRQSRSNVIRFSATIVMSDIANVFWYFCLTYVSLSCFFFTIIYAKWLITHYKMSLKKIWPHGCFSYFSWSIVLEQGTVYLFSNGFCNGSLKKNKENHPYGPGTLTQISLNISYNNNMSFPWYLLYSELGHFNQHFKS